MRSDKVIGKTIIQAIVECIFQNIFENLYESNGLIWILKFMMFVLVVRIGFQVSGSLPVVLFVLWLLFIGIGGDKNEARENFARVGTRASASTSQSSGFLGGHSLVGNGIDPVQFNASSVAGRKNLRLRNRGACSSTNRRLSQHPLSLLQENAGRSSCPARPECQHVVWQESGTAYDSRAV